MRSFLIKTVCILLTLTSLTSYKTSSKFISESERTGMSKEQVIPKFGKPYNLHLQKIKHQ